MRALSPSMRYGHLLGLLVVVGTACGAASSEPNAPSHHTSWSELSLTWTYGPCPSDGRSCHQVLTVQSNGAFIAAESPNGGGEAVRRFSSLTPRETRDLHRIVDAPFVDKVGSLPCAMEYDATITLDVKTPSGVRRQEIGGCVHASTASPSRALVELLDSHRFASHDQTPTHPPPPGAEGETCSETSACAKGLVCAIAPCVVAPCTSGSCQKN